MKIFVFSEATLSQALAAREAERQREGATDQQAKDETQVVLEFLGWAVQRDPKLVINAPH